MAISSDTSSSTLRILHTEWSQGWGGQEIRILGETLALIESGHSVQIAAHPESELAARATQAGVPVHPVRLHKGLPLRALLQLIRIIRKERIDVIHTHSSVDARIGGMTARITGRAVVRSRHLSTPIKKRWISWFLYMRLADHVITSGESIRQAMIHSNGMLPERITSIPAGIDTETFYPRAVDRDLKSNLGLSDQHFIIGIVAVLRSWKGHRTLFEAIAQYRKRNPDIRLLVLGDGPTRGNLEALRAELGLESHILMTGHVTDTPRYYSIMDGVILTSYSNEATSQTLPQAMLMEKAVIGTDIGSIPEVVIDGETGILIPPKDPEQIAEAIDRLYQDHDERQRLAQQGRAHALAHFTKKGMMESTVAVYREVLAP